MSLKRPSQSPSSNSSLLVPISAGTTFGSFPTLLEFLTSTKWDDGQSRVPGTLLIFVDEGKWKVCLKDKDARRVAFLSAPDLDLLFLGVEEGLEQDRLDWRADKPVKR